MPALLALSLALALAPPSDDVVRTHVQAYEAWIDASARDETYAPDALAARADAVFDALPIDELSADQLSMLTFRNGPAMRTTRRAEVVARLAELAAAPTPDGAHAATVLVMVAAYDDQAALLAAARGALSHPALADAIRAGHGEQMFESLGRYVDADGARAISAEILGVTPVLPDDASPRLVSSLATLVRMLARVCTPEQRDDYHALRLRVLEIARNTAAADTPAIATEDEARLASIARFLDGAFARLELMDHPLPPTPILWSTEPMRSLAPEGRVVVVEFFATWCAGCIAEFPNMRRFAERYQGYPVTLVGASELEGWHYPVDGTDRIDTSADPDLEYRLMEGFIDHHDVRWPVAFVPNGFVFEQLGSGGIPHGVVVDPAGIVRAETPWIARDYERLCALVDDLLREAGLPAPDAAP